MDSPESNVSLQDEIKALRQQLAVIRFDIRGKDWLTVDEAAHYCGVSSRQFRRNAPDLGLVPRNFMGKQLYEKNELYKSIQNASDWTTRGHVGSNTPAMVPSSAGVAEALARLRRYDQRRGKG
ncbi:hypothetical protein [Stenotrophomonas maltophilia]|uniref:hypothetical protein n=1 Tax=Stenotrophomonas maltophilia TaxID=40324 RepID=UPI0015DC3103|nr:hypothetical protein [Stenotrophomonas maltophilia]QDL29612.1 hypothetical protein EGM71_18315 [Stenotrophomonas maltophilia]